VVAVEKVFEDFRHYLVWGLGFFGHYLVWVLGVLGHCLVWVWGVEGVGVWVSGFGLGFRVQSQREDRVRLLVSGSRISSSV